MGIWLKHVMDNGQRYQVNFDVEEKLHAQFERDRLVLRRLAHININTQSLIPLRLNGDNYLLLVKT